MKEVIQTIPLTLDKKHIVVFLEDKKDKYRNYYNRKSKRDMSSDLSFKEQQKELV